MLYYFFFFFPSAVLAEVVALVGQILRRGSVFSEQLTLQAMAADKRASETSSSLRRSVNCISQIEPYVWITSSLMQQKSCWFLFSFGKKSRKKQKNAFEFLTRLIGVPMNSDFFRQFTWWPSQVMRTCCRKRREAFRLVLIASFRWEEKLGDY